MVRLKALNQLMDMDKLLIFQFQNGTIKRRVITLNELEDVIFQFQNGTIKSNKSLFGSSS